MAKTVMNKPDGIPLKDAWKQNIWTIIPISKLPDNAPVFVVTEYQSKDLAKFFFAKKVLYPLQPRKRKSVLKPTTPTNEQ